MVRCAAGMSDSLSHRVIYDQVHLCMKKTNCFTASGGPATVMGICEITLTPLAIPSGPSPRSHRGGE